MGAINRKRALKRGLRQKQRQRRKRRKVGAGNSQSQQRRHGKRAGWHTPLSSPASQCWWVCSELPLGAGIGGRLLMGCQYFRRKTSMQEIFAMRWSSDTAGRTCTSARGSNPRCPTTATAREPLEGASLLAYFLWRGARFGLQQ